MNRDERRRSESIASRPQRARLRRRRPGRDYAYRRRRPESAASGGRTAFPPRLVSAGNCGHDDVNPGVPVRVGRVLPAGERARMAAVIDGKRPGKALGARGCPRCHRQSESREIRPV